MIEFNYDGENWLYLPEEHKTAGSGQERPIVFCKASQEILKKWMRFDEPDKPIFRNRYGKPYSSAEYGRKIKRVIEKNGLPKFVPYQVRHTVATEVEKEYGIEHARALLGHSTVEMTRKYVHGDVDKIKQIASDRNRAMESPDSPSPSES